MMMMITGEVTSRAGHGRNYVVKWSDNSTNTVSSSLMFGAFTTHQLLDRGDHVLAWHSDHFSPGTVLAKSRKTAKLTIRFPDGSTRYEKSMRKNVYERLFVTSTKEVMFLPDFVCLSVCLCVSKITQKVMDGSF